MSAAFRRMPLVYMICTEMFGNGVLILCMIIIRVRLLMVVFGEKRKKGYWLNGLAMMMKAFLSCVAARGSAARGGHARRSAAGIRGLTVAGTTVSGSPGYCSSFYFILLPFFGGRGGVPLAGL